MKRKKLLMSWPGTESELEYVQKYVTPERRLEVLIAEADRVSGARWRALTVSLNEKNEQALLVCPMFIGGDSSDITVFVEDVWNQPVTDENYREVAQAFRAWYAQHAPDEYHAPEPTWTLREMGYGDWRQS